ncbi:MAG: chloride channel protein, partial [Anaerolineales bacterium]
TRLLYLSEDIWDGFSFPEYFKPVIGGLILGVIGIISPKIGSFPRAFGVGYDSISEALFGSMALKLTLSLFLLKLVATIITLGAGGSGGIFAPSLFMGAMLGETFGQFAGQLFPSVTAPPGAYAMVGMAAFFSGAAHAPVTAILILFELTGNYEIILPLMLATVTSTLLSRALSPESIYTLKLTRRGVHLQEGKDLDVMQTITVGEAMSKSYDVVSSDLSLKNLAIEFERSHHHGFPVVDRDDKLVGVVTIQDLERALEDELPDSTPVEEIATCQNLITAYDDEPMWTALRKLGVRDVGRLPVVKRGSERQLVGVVRRKDIIQAYNLAIVQRAQHQSRADRQRLGKIIDSKFIELDLPSTSPVIGSRISEIKLPEDCLIVSIQRGRKLFIAHGYSVLEVGDQLTVITREDVAQKVMEILLGGR